MPYPSRSRARLLMVAGGLLVLLATSASAYRGSVRAGAALQGEDPRREQLRLGWDTYRLWCSACHAYSGEGLTPAWISTWAPDDQNCWQSKCHHEFTHPDDGFYLPPDIPAIVGPDALAPFGNGPALFAYVSTLMPYQEPGALSQEQYYAVLAHLLTMNGIDYGSEPLGPSTLEPVRLGPATQALPPAPVVEAPEVHIMPPVAPAAAPPASPRPTAWLAGLLISLGLAAIASAAVAVESHPRRG